MALTHSLAIRLEPTIRVNCISPGWIDVSGAKKTGKADDLRSIDHRQPPAYRVGQGADMAGMILFLLDDQNSFITAQNFIVDGSMTRRMIYG